LSEQRAGRVCDVALVVLAVALPLSIAVSELTLGVVLLAWLATRPWTRPVPRGLRLLAWATAALAASWILASVTADDPWASLVKARKLWSMALVFVVADRARAVVLGDRLALFSILSGGASAVVGIVDHLLDRRAPGYDGERLSSTFSNAMTSGNVFASLVIAAAGELFSPRLARVARLAAGVGLVVLGVALLGSQTRSAWLAVLAGAGLLLLRLRPRGLLALAAIVGLIVAFGPAELRARAASMVDPAHPGNAGRISLWKSGLAALADRPWTGVGLADHYALIERHRRPDATFHAGHFHNNLVQVAVSTGLVGLLAYVAWMGMVGVLLVRVAARPGWGRGLIALAVWVAFQVHGMFDWSFGDAEVANQFFLWTGLGLAARDPLAEAENPAISAHPNPMPVRALSGPPPAA
jgi:O-antigen ligase